MTDCLFCKIIGGQIPGQFVHQDDQLVAIKDINPQAPLHVLIVPRKHIATLNDLDRGRRCPRRIDASRRGRHRQGARIRRARLPDGVQLQPRGRADRVPHSSAPARGRLAGRLGWPPGSDSRADVYRRVRYRARQLLHRSNHRHIGRRHRVVERCTSTPRIPTRRAPSMSCDRLSPTITDSLASTPASVSAAAKMLGCGFM